MRISKRFFYSVLICLLWIGTNGAGFVFGGEWYFDLWRILHAPASAAFFQRVFKTVYYFNHYLLWHWVWIGVGLSVDKRFAILEAKIAVARAECPRYET